MKHIALALAAAIGFTASAPAVAEDAHHKNHPTGKQAETVNLTAGMVKKIDKDAGELSIAHEAIDNLAMRK